MNLLRLLDELVKLGGSDLHLSSDRPPYFRLNGEIYPRGDAIAATDLLAQILPLVPEELRDRYDRDKELDFAFSLENGQRFRANLYLERHNPAVALRALSSTPPDFEQLELPATLADFCELPRGLLLVTGPTGSGKSTTLAACLNRIVQRHRRHLITIEDPIEYIFPDGKGLVHQRQLGQDTNSFARALRAALREDPDVIMVGEMRDLETIQLAITAAETGHLVLSTLHTRSAATTVDRIVDVFPAEQQEQIRVQLSNSLVGICSQSLCRQADGHSRVVATEVLVNTPAAANLIREGKTAQIYSLLQAGSDQGMHTLEQDLARLIRQNRLALDDALTVTSRAQELRNLTAQTQRPLHFGAESLESFITQPRPPRG